MSFLAVFMRGANTNLNLWELLPKCKEEFRVGLYLFNGPPFFRLALVTVGLLGVFLARCGLVSVGVLELTVDFSLGRDMTFLEPCSPSHQSTSLPGDRGTFFFIMLLGYLVILDRVITTPDCSLFHIPNGIINRHCAHRYVAQYGPWNSLGHLGDTLVLSWYPRQATRRMSPHGHFWVSRPYPINPELKSQTCKNANRQFSSVHGRICPLRIQHHVRSKGIAYFMSSISY